MNYRELMKPTIGNGLVLFLLIIFFPLGVVLMFIRHSFHGHRSDLIISDTVVWSRCFFTFGLVWMLIILIGTDDEAVRLQFIFIPLIIFMLPGWLFYSKSQRQLHELEQRFNVYRKLLIAGERNITKLAYLAKVHRRTVANDLHIMSYLKLLTSIVWTDDGSSIVSCHITNYGDIAAVVAQIAQETPVK